MNRHSDSKRDAEPVVELESQFILRVPPEPAKVIREAIRSGASNLKDRLFIKLENDIRYGEVRMDHWLMHAKLVDLPTIIESMKTIDGKNFYKTADICQMLICKDEDDQTTDEESPAKKKKDPNKVDKKFLWPHGVTPPLKNVRKRRFRKTLKKKYVEAPEIEKEVKRLLRVDNEAVKVTWEVINEEEDKPKPSGKKGEGKMRAGDASLEASTQHSVDVAEHDIFGEALSDSEEEETNINIMEMEDENSRLSGEDSMHTMDSSSVQATHNSEKNQQPLVTQFSREMFSGQSESSHNVNIKQELEREHDNERDFDRSFDHHDRDHSSLMKEESTMDYDDDDYHDGRPSSADHPKDNKFNMDLEGMSSDTNMFEQRRLRKDQLEAELPELRARCQQQELEISNLENQALRQRFQEKLDNMLSELLEKEQEYQELCQE
ncbi:hypothetical protein ONE63_007859 [Megalurothrips usitatus]|uniref:TAFII55 protein conserved region domain-containing protein n=1 Tax=Megalurothrips usitatus TaxID=439358 RepID=A0AAV7XVX9_9NEOP|nr:hypothetical protein ONE63_007859 [Megalurothrips usitatus]